MGNFHFIYTVLKMFRHIRNVFLIIFCTFFCLLFLLKKRSLILLFTRLQFFYIVYGSLNVLDDLCGIVSFFLLESVKSAVQNSNVKELMKGRVCNSSLSIPNKEIRTLGVNHLHSILLIRIIMNIL